MNTLTVPGTLDSLGQIRTFIRDACEQAGLDRKRIYRLQLAVDEIATNIINYGYAPSGIQGDINVLIEMDENELRIILQDSSPPFDPFTRDRPEQITQSLEERPTGGLGIFLARENVDDYRYAYQNGCNHNIFVLHRAPAGQAGG